MNVSQQARWDRLGISLSGLCVVHCLAVPALLIALPRVSLGGLEGEWVHVALLAAAIPVSSTAFWRGLRLHGCAYPSAIGGMGLAILAAALILPSSEASERVVTVAGALVLAAGHWRNHHLSCTPG